MDRNGIALGQWPVGFGLEPEDHIEWFFSPTVPDPGIAMMDVVTGVVVLEPVLYSFEIVCAFIAMPRLRLASLIAVLSAFFPQA